MLPFHIEVIIALFDVARGAADAARRRPPVGVGYFGWCVSVGCFGIGACDVGRGDAGAGFV